MKKNYGLAGADSDDDLEGVTSNSSATQDALMARIAQSKKLKIGFAAFGEMGHLTPLVRIGDALAERGHEIVYFTNGWAKEKLTKMLNMNDVKAKVVTPNQMSRNMFFFGAEQHTGQVVFQPGQIDRQLIENFRAAYEAEKLDLLITDFQACFTVTAADKLGLPVMHHAPAPYMVMDVLLELQAPCPARTNVCGGLMCIGPHYLDAIIKGFAKVFGQPQEFYDVARTFQSRTIICSTWPGFDLPALLPPNVILHGPVMKPMGGMMKSLSEKDPGLYAWLEDALRLKQRVFFLTLGSECRWEPWSIKAVKEGCAKLVEKENIRVLWGFAKVGQPGFEHPYGENNDRYWVAAWLPQVEALHHPAVAVGFSHVGFGGCTEFIHAGLPLVTFPHFFDQPLIADLLVDAGAGIRMHDWPLPARPIPGEGFTMAYHDPLFTAEDMYTKVSKIINDPEYKYNAMRLKVASKAQGGRELAVQSIERTWVAYMNATKVKRQEFHTSMLEPHCVVDQPYIDRTNTFGWFYRCGAVCCLLVFAIHTILYGFIGLFPAIDVVAGYMS